MPAAPSAVCKHRLRASLLSLGSLAELWGIYSLAELWGIYSLSASPAHPGVLFSPLLPHSLPLAHGFDSCLLQSQPRAQQEQLGWGNYPRIPPRGFPFLCSWVFPAPARGQAGTGWPRFLSHCGTTVWPLRRSTWDPPGPVLHFKGAGKEEK